MQLLKGHTDVAHVLAFSADGSLLASASADATVRLWHFPSGTQRAVLPSSAYPAPGLAFSPDGLWLAAPAPVLRDVATRVWSLTNLERCVDLPLSAGGGDVHQWTHDVVFTPDGRLVTTGARYWEYRGGYQHSQVLLRSWTVGNWAESALGDFDIPGGVGGRHTLTLDPHAALLAVPDSQGTMFWDLKTGKELFRFQGDSVGDAGAVVFSPDGSRFGIGRSRSVQVCDVSGQRVLASWKNPTRKHVQSVAFAPDGRTLATVSNDTAARLWDTDTGREKAAYGWDIGPLKAVAFAPDGMRAAAGSRKGTIVVWDVE